MQHLVLLSYGRESEYRRAIFAALSFWANYQGPRQAVSTVIFTDDAAFFRPYLAALPVEYVQLDADRRRAMHGPHDYVHRVKIGILDEVMHRYPRHDVLYIDTDTFFEADPAPLLGQLAAGTAFMHKPEYQLAEAVGVYAGFEPAVAACPPRFLALLGSRTFRVLGRERRFTGAQLGWNSGVLGLPADAAGLLPDVFRLTDEFFAGSGWFTSEQLAFSLALPLVLPLRRCDESVFHYWQPGQKQRMDALLARLLTLAFSRQPLPMRLGAVRAQLGRFRGACELATLREGARYAFGKRRWLSAARLGLKAMLHAPFQMLGAE
jgi:hypothetical protein